MNKRKLFRRCIGKVISIYANREAIARGKLIYDQQRHAYQVDRVPIPLPSLRNVALWNYNGIRALVFVDPAYNLQNTGAKL